jgi:hypothetical protein
MVLRVSLFAARNGSRLEVLISVRGESGCEGFAERL